MPKSYKITYTEIFDENRFEKEKFEFNEQVKLPVDLGSIELPPSTSIELKGEAGYLDLLHYQIEHEHIENAYGRSHGHSFTSFIKKGLIEGYHSNDLESLFLLSGKKRDVLAFCKDAQNKKHIVLNTIQIDTSKLLAKLPSVRGVWFKTDRGLITSTAFFGKHIENADEFKKYEGSSNITSLSFCFEHLGSYPPIMITDDGAVVLQGVFQKIEHELELVVAIKKALIDDISSLVKPKAKGKKAIDST